MKKQKLQKPEVDVIVFDNQDDIVTESNTQEGTVTPPAGPTGSDDF